MRAPSAPTPSKYSQLREHLTSRNLSVFLEAHNGLSAKVVEEAGFPAIWASSLSLSAALGVRDNNEASWTQVLDQLEFMSDATSIPILADGDTGYGDFNTMRRVVQKLEQREVAGVCIEDKVFPKTNSFLRNGRQPLESVEAFTAKIKAGKDAQQNPDFSLVARTEAFITGHGLGEALERAEAYREAGADALVIHSKSPDPGEVFAFLKEWDQRLPVVLIPTKYYTTPPGQLHRAGASVVIWANHLLRSSLQSMQETASRIFRDGSAMAVEEKVAPLAEVFRIQGDEELREAESKYRGKPESGPWAVILAATRGSALEDLTESIPKTLLPVAGISLLERHVRNLRSLGFGSIQVVAGYRKEAIDLPGIQRIDNEDWEETGEAASLWAARSNLEGEGLILFGDILCRRYMLQMLLGDEADFVLAVDRSIPRRKDQRPRDLVQFSGTPEEAPFLDPVYQVDSIAFSADASAYDGEWIGILKVSARGARVLGDLLDSLQEKESFRSMQMTDLFQELMSQGETLQVHPVPSHWTAVETALDFMRANSENL